MKVYFAFNIFLLCACMTTMFRQYDYNLIHHHVELTYTDKTVFEGTIKNVKPNRTYRAYDVVGVIKRELYGDAFKIGVHCSYFLSNEYKNTPIQFDIKICDALEKNLFGLRDIMSSYANITTRCPLKPGYYALRNFNVADETLPPNIPEGDYQVKLLGFWGKTKISELKWFGSIKYKVKRRG